MENLEKVIMMLNWLAKEADAYDDASFIKTKGHGIRINSAKISEKALPKYVGNMICFLDQRKRANKNGQVLVMTPFKVITQIGGSLRMSKIDMAELGSWYGQCMSLQSFDFINKLDD